MPPSASAMKKTGLDMPTLVKGAVLRESLRRRPVPRSRRGSGRGVFLGSVNRLAIWVLVRRICAAAGISFSSSSSSVQVCKDLE